MLLRITEKEALDLIQSPEIIYDEQLVPARFRECPDSPYRSGYDWLYRYERKIAAFVEPWLKNLRYELIGEKGILCEALSNAFFHGHRKNAELPIGITIYQANRGLMIRITDSGQGFSIRNVYRQYSNRNQYYTSAGNGIRLMATNTHFGIFFSPKGNTFYLLYLFSFDLKFVWLRWGIESSHPP